MVFKIALDAGHAGFGVTPGKRTPAGEYEWHFNDENVDAFMKEMNQYENVAMKIVSDPNGKRDVPLTERTDAANDWGADIYLSFHHNANTGKWGTWTGTETYRFNKDTGNASKSLTLTNLAHKASIQAYGLKDRGVKRANFAVLRQTHMPATLLEGGYMDSSIDIKVLRDKNKTAQLGINVAKAVAAQYGLKRKSGSVTPVTKEEVSIGTLYRVQAGAFSKTENAAQLASDIRKKGFVTYIVQVEKLFKVQIGAFANKANAEAQLKKVQAAGFEAFITTNGSVAVPTAEPINEPGQEVITVDGLMGEETIRRMQHYFGTPEDGIISRPSMMVKELQKLVGATVDGYLGKNTISKLQAFLGTPVDGVISKPSSMVKELQRQLNAGKLVRKGPTTPKGPTIKEGAKVKIKSGAKTYATGQNIPSGVKGKSYTIQQVKSDRVLLKEIMSWVKRSDVE